MSRMCEECLFVLHGGWKTRDDIVDNVLLCRREGALCGVGWGNAWTGTGTKFWDDVLWKGKAASFGKRRARGFSTAVGIPGP
jgi:hypothetical protein